MLRLLLGLEARLVLVEPRFLGESLQTVVLQFDVGMGQFDVFVLQLQHSGLGLELFVLQFVGHLFQHEPLVCQAQVLRFVLGHGHIELFLV